MEDGAEVFNLVVASQKQTYLIGDVGARISREFKTASENRITPFIEAKYHIADGRDDREIFAGFTVDPLGRRDIALLSATDSDNAFFSLDLGLAATIGGGSISGQYSTIRGLSGVGLNRVSVRLSLPLSN